MKIHGPKENGMPEFDYEKFCELVWHIMIDERTQIEPTFSILGYDLVETCGACPEQYDVYSNGEPVGYFRLRHGRFSASNWYQTIEIYSAYPEGDGLFEYDEREGFLTEAVKSLDEYLKHNKDIT